MNLIILQTSDMLSDGRYVLTGERADHINNILRASQGDTLEVGLLNGARGCGVVCSVAKSEVVLNCTFEDEVLRPAVQVDVVCALPRPQTLKKVLHSAAAMGVGNLYFIRSARVEKSYFHSPMLKPENYERFLIEGLSQGKNTCLPKVSFYDKFKAFMVDTLADLDGVYSYRKIVFSPDGEHNLLQAGISTEKPVLIALGPEGGWVPFELELMKSSGFESVTLGNWILRVENALVASLAQLELATQ